ASHGDRGPGVLRHDAAVGRDGAADAGHSAANPGASADRVGPTDRRAGKLRFTMSIHDDLRPILDAIAIVSPTAFFFRGESIAVQPGPVQPLPGMPAHPLPQMPLVRELQSVLYTRCYAQRFENPQAQPAFTSDPAYVQRLSAANHTQPRWEAGWM